MSGGVNHFSLFTLIQELGSFTRSRAAGMRSDAEHRNEASQKQAQPVFEGTEPKAHSNPLLVSSVHFRRNREGQGWVIPKTFRTPPAVHS